MLKTNERLVFENCAKRMENQIKVRKTSQNEAFVAINWTLILLTLVLPKKFFILIKAIKMIKTNPIFIITLILSQTLAIV